MAGEIIINTLVILCLFQAIAGNSYSTSFKIVNNCGFSVWPAMLSNPGTMPLPSTGFILGAGEYAAVEVPPNWSGRVYARTFCSNDSNGVFSCLTGDCGSSTLQCPATFAEFILNGGAGGLDLFQVNLVDGCNIPMIVEPKGGSGGNCMATGPCVIDLNMLCPSELKVMMNGEAVGCKSPCQAFGDSQSCCTQTYATPQTCKTSNYTMLFKNACPKTRVYLYDQTSTFTCANANYVITFCPSPPEPTSVKPPLKAESTPEKKDSSGGGFINILKNITIIASSIITIIIFIGITYQIVAWLRGRASVPTAPLTLNVNAIPLSQN